MGKTYQTCTISELAVQLAISPSSIRFYENNGLIRPGRTSGNHMAPVSHPWVVNPVIVKCLQRHIEILVSAVAG